MRVAFSTSMRCGACLARVSPLLDASAAVETWSADLDDPRKLLRVQLVAPAQAGSVVDLLQQAGFDGEVTDDAPTVVSLDVPASKKTLQLSTYKPLLLVVVYVLGASLLFEAGRAEWIWTRLMSNFMGFFFLGFAFFKLLSISKFADAFSSYDIVARRSRLYALIYPWIEVTLGLLFVTGTALVAANLLTALIMSVGLIGVVRAVRRKQAIQCACLGTAFNLPMSSVTIIENSIMIVMSVSMLFV